MCSEEIKYGQHISQMLLKRSNLQNHIVPDTSIFSKAIIFFLSNTCSETSTIKVYLFQQLIQYSLLNIMNAYFDMYDYVLGLLMIEL